MVGKTTFIQNCLTDHVIYHATHDLTDQTIGRKSSWSLGFAILDFLSQSVSQGSEIKVAIDRGIFSSMVYSEIYDKSPVPEVVVNWYRNNQFFKNNVEVIHVTHDCKESAKEIYQRSLFRVKNSNSISDKYDKFSSFEEYWSAYLRFEEKFLESYRKVGKIPRVVLTLPKSKDSFSMI